MCLSLYVSLYARTCCLRWLATCTLLVHIDTTHGSKKLGAGGRQAKAEEEVQGRVGAAGPGDGNAKGVEIKGR